MAKRLNIQFSAQPYTLQASSGRIWVGSPSSSLTPVGIASLTHGQSFTITGSGFGTQSGGVVLRDVGNAAANTLDPQWSGAWPNASAPAQYNTQNQPTTFNPTGGAVGAPHPYVSQMLAGAHYTSGTPSALAGFDVLAYLTYTAPAFPYALYVHYFQRMDPNCVFGLNSGDNNYKFMDFSSGNQPFGAPQNYTICQPGAGPSSAAAHVSYGFDDPSLTLQFPDGNGHGNFWNNSPSPWQAWLDTEYAAGLTNAAGLAGGGYIAGMQSGVTYMNYAGRSDGLTGTTRTLSIGGYWRNYPNINNYRYFADVLIYISATGTLNPTMLWLTNASTYAASTIRIPQVPTSWSNNSISFNCWKATLLSGNVYAQVSKTDGTFVTSGPYFLN